MKRMLLVCAAMLVFTDPGLRAHAEPPPSLAPLPTGTDRIVLQPIQLQATEAATLKPGGPAQLTYEREPSKSISLRVDNCKSAPRSLPRDVTFDLHIDHVLPCFGTDTEKFPPLVRQVAVQALSPALLGAAVLPTIREQGHEYHLTKFELAGELCDASGCVSDAVEAWVDCSGNYETSAVTALATLRYQQQDKGPRQRCGFAAKGDLPDDAGRALTRLRSNATLDVHMNPVYKLPALPLPQGGWVRNLEAGFSPGCSVASLRAVTIPGTELGLRDEQNYVLNAYPARDTKTICSLFVRPVTRNGGAITECFPVVGSFNGHYLFDAQGVVRFEAQDLRNNKRFELAFQNGQLIDLFELLSVEFHDGHFRENSRIWQAQAAALWPHEVAPLDDASAYSCYLNVGEKARRIMQQKLDAQPR